MIINLFYLSAYNTKAQLQIILNSRRKIRRNAVNGSKKESHLLFLALNSQWEEKPTEAHILSVINCNI